MKRRFRLSLSARTKLCFLLDFNIGKKFSGDHFTWNLFLRSQTTYCKSQLSGLCCIQEIKGLNVDGIRNRLYWTRFSAILINSSRKMLREYDILKEITICSSYILRIIHIHNPIHSYITYAGDKVTLNFQEASKIKQTLIESLLAVLFHL
jgi:hypothetical protein